MRGHWWLLGLGTVVAGALVLAAAGRAGILDASWTAPRMSVDGRALTELARYRIYYAVEPRPCPGQSFFEVASSARAPAPDQTVLFTLTGLSAGARYHVAVTAIDVRGNESACSAPASAVARSIVPFPLPWSSRGQ